MHCNNPNCNFTTKNFEVLNDGYGYHTECVDVITATLPWTSYKTNETFNEVVRQRINQETQIYDTFQIYLKNNSKSYILAVRIDETVEVLRKKVQMMTGFSPESQILKYGPKELADGNILGFYGIRRNATINMSHRCLGGS